MLRQTRRIIDFDDFIEAQNFTKIHQIVCGLSNASLDIALQVSNDIDSLDSEGRSALCYAVTHRQHDYVRQLLEAGADPNIGDSPFLRAVSNESDYANTKILLDHGANFGSFKDSWTLDQWDNIYGSDALAMDEMLVKHGLDPNHRGDGSRTILMVLARKYYDDSRRLKQLIELGSDIEIADEVGLTAIMYAVSFSSPSAFGILAHAGARVDLKSANGRTILHLAICSKKTWMIPWLCYSIRDADLTKLDLDAKDGNGHTAFDLLRMRNGPDWEHYCKHIGTDWYSPSSEYRLKSELKAISALENLLHYVQEVQGVPEADRYPPLGEYCSRVVEEELVPGAWPMYEGDRL